MTWIRRRVDRLEEAADLRLRAARDVTTLTDEELELIAGSGSPALTAALHAAPDEALEAIASGEVADPEMMAQLLGIDVEALEGQV